MHRAAPLRLCREGAPARAAAPPPHSARASLTAPQSPCHPLQALYGAAAAAPIALPLQRGFAKLFAIVLMAHDRVGAAPYFVPRTCSVWLLATAASPLASRAVWVLTGGTFWFHFEQCSLSADLAIGAACCLLLRRLWRRDAELRSRFRGNEAASTALADKVK